MKFTLHYDCTFKKMDSAAPQTPLPGMIVIPEFITRDDETRLLDAIDTQGEWDASEIRRRTQHYGYRYHYTGAKRGELSKAAEFPVWSEILQNRIHERLELGKDGLPQFEQMIVNEYTKGQGISKHTDHTKAFGNTIVSLSLAGECQWTMRRRDHPPVTMTLEPRTLVVLSGDARYAWTHEIPPVTCARRVSLTLRYLAATNPGRTNLPWRDLVIPSEKEIDAMLNAVPFSRFKRKRNYNGGSGAAEDDEDVRSAKK